MDEVAGSAQVMPSASGKWQLGIMILADESMVVQ
jgi:hypothetical protein